MNYLDMAEGIFKKRTPEERMAILKAYEAEPKMSLEELADEVEANLDRIHSWHFGMTPEEFVAQVRAGTYGHV